MVKKELAKFSVFVLIGLLVVIGSVITTIADSSESSSGAEIPHWCNWTDVDRSGEVRSSDVIKVRRKSNTPDCNWENDWCDFFDVSCLEHFSAECASNGGIVNSGDTIKVRRMSNNVCVGPDISEGYCVADSDDGNQWCKIRNNGRVTVETYNEEEYEIAFGRYDHYTSNVILKGNDGQHQVWLSEGESGILGNFMVTAEDIILVLNESNDLEPKGVVVKLENN